jgi:hypothetical protein
MKFLFQLLEKLGFTSESYCRPGIVTKVGTVLGVGCSLALFFARI